MAATMEKTRHAGIYKRGGRYVVVWWHKGRQHKAAYKTLAEAREAKGSAIQASARRLAARTSRSTRASGSRATAVGRRAVSALAPATRRPQGHRGVQRGTHARLAGGRRRVDRLLAGRGKDP
jgi:hypothetical protein